MSVPLGVGLEPEAPPLLLAARASSVGFHAGISLCRSDSVGDAALDTLLSLIAAANPCPLAEECSGCAFWMAAI